MNTSLNDNLLRGKNPQDSSVATITSEQQEQTGVIKQIEKEFFAGQVIGKIASSFYYVKSKVLVSELAEELDHNEDIFAVGVVDENDKIMGLIVRQELFDRLGKPFGRDLYTNKPVQSIMEETDAFHFQRNIFSIADELGNKLNDHNTEYYLIYKKNETFGGIFSSKDMLIYLSVMMQKDIALAKRLQSCIVKDVEEKITDHFSIVGSSVMAKGVGGDFYSIQPIEEGRWFFSICDVSGKGMSAALLSVIIGGMESIYNFNYGIENFLISLNEYIFNSFQAEKFITGVFIDFDENTGELSLYDVGHSYFYIFRKNKFIKAKTKINTVPIGITQDFLPEKIKFKLQPDDILILITDGIEEQKNSQGEEYGIKNVQNVFKNNPSVNITEIKDILFQDIRDFRKSQSQHDDMTLIFLQYHG